MSGIADACATTLANGDAPLNRDRAAPPAQRSSSRYCRGAEGAALDVVDLSFERYIGGPTPKAHVYRRLPWAALSPLQRDCVGDEVDLYARGLLARDRGAQVGARACCRI